jgi:hypothetical protein
VDDLTAVPHDHAERGSSDPSNSDSRADRFDRRLHRGTGPVTLVEVDGKTFVRFENVAIQNGPDLHVYLARGMGGAYDGGRDLYLGALKATNGSFNYELPGGTPLGDYKSVVVWCRAFTVLFTWADLR